MTNNTIADLAETRQKDKQSLLEERGDRVVEISRLGEVPKLLDNLRRIRRRHKEIGYETEAPGYVTVKRAQDAQRDRRKPIGIALAALRGFNDLLGQGFLYDRGLAFDVKGPAGNIVGLAQIMGRLGVEAATSKNRYDGGHYAYPGRQKRNTTVVPTGSSGKSIDRWRVTIPRRCGFRQGPDSEL